MTQHYFALRTPGAPLSQLCPRLEVPWARGAGLHRWAIDLAAGGIMVPRQSVAGCRPAQGRLRPTSSLASTPTAPWPPSTGERVRDHHTVDGRVHPRCKRWRTGPPILEAMPSPGGGPSLMWRVPVQAERLPDPPVAGCLRNRPAWSGAGRLPLSVLLSPVLRIRRLGSSVEAGHGR
jgi:hypothetical protein